MVVTYGIKMDECVYIIQFFPVLFGAVEGIYGPQNTPMLWRFIIAGTKEHFEGRKHPQSSQRIHPLSGGVIARPLEASAWSTRPHVER
jgi:hypothetical protein